MLETLTGDMSVGLHFIFRWLHVFFGVIWIGVLYYFNFIQGSFLAETDAAAKAQVTQKLLPRALWWFRWGAMWTFVSGVVMLAIKSHVEASAGGLDLMNNPFWINILTGALMGTLMFLNVWLIIWPAQKIVIASAVQVAGGGQANPEAAKVAPKAALASRTNTLFSAPMLFFMLGASHLLFPVTDSSNVMLYWGLILALVGAIELNAIFGKPGPIATVKGVVTCSFALTAIMVLINIISF